MARGGPSLPGAANLLPARGIFARGGESLAGAVNLCPGRWFPVYRRGEGLSLFWEAVLLGWTGLGWARRKNVSSVGVCWREK